MIPNHYIQPNAAEIYMQKISNIKDIKHVEALLD